MKILAASALKRTPKRSWKATSLAGPVNADLFPELDVERARLAFARSSRDRMISRLEAVDPAGAADEITKEYIEVTVADALEDLRGPGAGDFFGRIDEWYIGRRHIEDDRHDPVVVDWRAPIAAPFYRATSVDPLGVAFRRRFTLDGGRRPVRSVTSSPTSTSTSTIPTRARWPAGSRTPCSPRSVPSVPARCARSCRRSRPSRTS